MNLERNHMSNNSLRGKEDYQEILLINGFNKVIEDEFEHYNKRARIRKKPDGYFYNTKDKNIYSNTHLSGASGFVHSAQIIIDYGSYEKELRFKAAVEKSDWLPIYEHTKFLIANDDEGAWFSFQFLPKEVHFLKKPFAIISAENPSMHVQSEFLNQTNNELMENTLRDNGYEFYPSVGELCGHLEKSFIIYNIDKENAIELGQKFQQESIVFNDGKSIEILECFTNKVALSFEFKNMYI